jgi:predicted amidohydrolase
MCDLLIEAAQIFRPAGHGPGHDRSAAALHSSTGGAAVAITSGRIVGSGPLADLAPELLAGAKRRVRVAGGGATLAPGLIDMHVHIDPTGGFPGDGNATTPKAGRISRYGVDPDKTYLPRGVTTVLSQGDAGAQTWAAYSAATAGCSVRCLMAMNILRAGEDPAYFRSGPAFPESEWDPRWEPGGPVVQRLADFDEAACVDVVRAAGELAWGVDVNAGHNHGPVEDLAEAARRAVGAALDVKFILSF